MARLYALIVVLQAASIAAAASGESNFSIFGITSTFSTITGSGGLGTGTENNNSIQNTILFENSKQYLTNNSLFNGAGTSAVLGIDFTGSTLFDGDGGGGGAGEVPKIVSEADVAKLRVVAIA